jgi:anthranilate phosphoribosyltransferase
MDMQAAIRAVSERRDLNAGEMTAIMNTIMSGGATPAQIGGFLVGLRMKGETVEEVAAAAEVMRRLATPVEVSPTHLVDTCGTGGDQSATFNISTTSAFVAAGAGARVAKHGNRSVSSGSGSADVLEAAGVKLDLTPAQVARCIDQAHVGFMFAPSHHAAMRHAVGPRREMGLRTLFNLLGPLANPARAPNQVVGVFAREWVGPLAQVLARLGAEKVLVVHSADGLDELSVGDETMVAELRHGEIRSYTVTPEQFGLPRTPVSALVVDSAEQSHQTMLAVLHNHEGPARDVVLLNAGAAIYAAGLSESLGDGVASAREAIASGAAMGSLEALIRLSHSA